MMARRQIGGGLECANCGGRILAVKDSRRSINSVRRRRKCLGCGRRVTTYEIMSPTNDDENRLAAALQLWDKLRSIPDGQRDVVVRMINVLSTRQPALAPATPLIAPPS